MGLSVSVGNLTGDLNPISTVYCELQDREKLNRDTVSLSVNQ